MRDAVDRPPDAGHERQQQQADADEGERVAVALEVARAAHDEEHADEAGDADERSTWPAGAASFSSRRAMTT